MPDDRDFSRLAQGFLVIYRQGPEDPMLERHPLTGEPLEDIHGCNGQLEHPAVVTRVFPDGLTHLTVMFDGATPEARRDVSPLPSTGIAAGQGGWRWP